MRFSNEWLRPRGGGVEDREAGLGRIKFEGDNEEQEEPTVWLIEVWEGAPLINNGQTSIRILP